MLKPLKFVRDDPMIGIIYNPEADVKACRCDGAGGASGQPLSLLREEPEDRDSDSSFPYSDGNRAVMCFGGLMKCVCTNHWNFPLPIDLQGN